MFGYAVFGVALAAGQPVVALTQIDEPTRPSPRKSSGYGCLVFGTLDAGSMDAVDNDETGPRRRGPVRG
jgi:hypothetical protein